MKKWVIFLLATPVGAVTNSMTFWEQAAVTTTNYPVQFGRPFVQGEIAQYPQVLFNGTPLTTQADVKERWPDTSVKHAIVSFLIPSLVANSTNTITFQNQATGNNTAVTKASMLSAYDFNAQFVFSLGISSTVNARDMLNAWDGASSVSTGPVQIWTSGPIATTIILADNSASRTFDVGTDTFKSVRPIFHATFWPTINKVHVRYISEIANTQSLQNQAYAISLTTGNASPFTWYTHASSFTQSGATRWTKTVWLGGTPPATGINHNLSYLTTTKMLPNFDTTLTASASSINALCTIFSGQGKDIGNAGSWDKNMPDAGSRADIGIYPDWIVYWLYSGNSCMRDMSTTNAELEGSWPIFLREGKANENILRSDPVGGSTGLGHIVSVSSRSTVNGYTNFGTVSQDTITAIGVMTTQGWSEDIAHDPEFGTPVYLLTGDYFYLENVWFLAGWNMSDDAVIGDFHRYTLNKQGYGVLNHGQVRAEAWALRDIINAASASPDGTPEQTYFVQLTSDSVAMEEGIRNVTTTAFNATPEWTFGRNNVAPSGGHTGFEGTPSVPAGTVTTLHQWTGGDVQFNEDEYGICCSAGSVQPPPASCNTNPTVYLGDSLFETDYILFSLGWAKELGYPTAPLLSWLSSFYTGMLTDPGYNPFMIDNGRVPVARLSDTNYFDTFANLKTGFNDSWQAHTSLATFSDPDGYAAYATSGISFLTGESNGQSAWNFMDTNYRSGNPVLAQNPKWALVPMTQSSTATQPNIISGTFILKGNGRF